MSLHLLTDEASSRFLPVLLVAIELHDLPTLMVSLFVHARSRSSNSEFFNENQDRSLLTIHFQTPTGFRLSGRVRYFFPTMSHLQSLMMKYARLLENRHQTSRRKL